MLVRGQVKEHKGLVVVDLDKENQTKILKPLTSSISSIKKPTNEPPEKNGEDYTGSFNGLGSIFNVSGST